MFTFLKRRNAFFTKAFGVLLSYDYQLLTACPCYISRYERIYSFFKIPRVSYVFVRFSEVTLAIEHMIYFSSRVRLVNISHLLFSWSAPLRSKSRRWKRKFWDNTPRLQCHSLLNPGHFTGFWQTFMVMYMSHLTYKGFFKKTGTGHALLHWFRRTNMYWEYPYMWSFFSSNMAVHYELMNYLLKIQLTCWFRWSFMMDRDLFRLLNFPITLYSLPRLWQPDPAKFVSILRVALSFS